MKWICFVVAFLSFSCSTAEREEAYREKINILQRKVGGFNPTHMINPFFETEKRYPESLNEMYISFKKYQENEAVQMALIFLIDPLSSSGDWYGYFPLYDNADTKIVSYLLLSAGIDGKINNKLSPSGRLHVDDWAQRLALYNPEEYAGAVHIDTPVGENQQMYTMGDLRHIPPYSARDERSGKKDLLLYVHHLVYIGDK
jgi:hypothetical protein